MTDEGVLIVFEGIDGCGKTTHSMKLREFLDSKGVKNIWTCEPYTKWAAVALSHTQDPLGQLFIFSGDRREHVKRMQQLLKEGYWVICDRYFFSTLAYQNFRFGLDDDFVSRCVRQSINAENGLLLPDLTLFLSLPLDKAIARIEARDKEPVTVAEREKLRLVNLSYEAIYQANAVDSYKVSNCSKRSFVRIDCNDRTEDDIQSEIRAIVDEKLLGVTSYAI